MGRHVIVYAYKAFIHLGRTTSVASIVFCTRKYKYPLGEFPSAISTGRFSERGVLRSEWHLSIKSHRVCAGNGETGLRCAMKSNGPACPGESSSRGAAMSSFAWVPACLLVKATPSAIRCYAPANLPCEGFCKRRPRPAVSSFV